MDDKNDEEQIKALKRRYKICECYVAVGSFEQAYTNELKRLDQERQKYERERRRAVKLRKSENESDNSDLTRKKKKSKDSKKRLLGSPSTSAMSPPQPTTKKKKTLQTLTICIVCDQPINPVHSGLPVGAIYCSKACIDNQVKIAGQCMKNDERVLLMDIHGMILNESRTPTLDALGLFLLQYPNFRPVLNMTKLDKSHKKEIDEQANKKVESKRVDVRKAIEHHLQQRSKASLVSHSSKRLKTISTEIEEELFRIYKSLNLKYRTWCKGFVHKIKDESNAFFSRIVTEKISVKKLVTMSPEEMYVSNAMLHKEVTPSFATTDTVNGNCDSNTMAQSDTEKAPSIASNNKEIEEHEELIMEDSPSPSVGSSNNTTGTESVKLPAIRYSSLVTKYTMVKKKPLIKVEGKSAVDDILGNERDTTGQHNSHLYDANCAICQKKTKLDFAAKERAERIEARFEAKKRIDNEEIRRMPKFPNLTIANKRSVYEGNDNTASPSFGSNRFTTPLYDSLNRDSNLPPLLSSVVCGMGDYNYDDDAVGGCFDDDDFSSGGFGERQNQKSFSEDHGWRDNGRTSREYNRRGSCERDNNSKKSYLRDSSPISKNFDSWARPRTSPSQEKRDFLPMESGPPRIMSWKKGGEYFVRRDENPWHSVSHRVWGGTFHWGRKYQFSCTFTALSNRVAFRLGSEMPLVTKVIGRIEPRNVWEYVRTLKDSWTKQVVVLMVDPPSMETREQYVSCYDLMRRENRYGVIDYSNHPTIKDGYVFALEPGEPLPKDLYPLEGPGLPEGSEQFGNIIVVIVRKVDREEPSKNSTLNRGDENWRNAFHHVKLTSADNVDNRSASSASVSSLTDALHHQRATSLLAEERSVVPPTHTDVSMPSSSPDNFARYLEATQEFEATSSMYEPPDNYSSSTSQPQQQILPETSPSTSKLQNLNAIRSSPAPSSMMMDDSINTLTDVLSAIQRMSKPAQIVLMVGHYISTHSVSEEESEIISRAIQAKSEAERLRNSRTTTPPADFVANSSRSSKNRKSSTVDKYGDAVKVTTSASKSPNNFAAAISAVAGTGNGVAITNSKVIHDNNVDRNVDDRRMARNKNQEEENNKNLTDETLPTSSSSDFSTGLQPEHFDIVKLRRPPRQVAEMRKKAISAATTSVTSKIVSKNNTILDCVAKPNKFADSDAVVATTLPETISATMESRPSSNSSADNDSTKAQQISFSADVTAAVLTPPTSEKAVENLSLPLLPPPPTSASVPASTPPPPPLSPPPPPPPPIGASPPLLEPSTQPIMPKKVPLLSVPVPVPPPVQSQFVYVFAPPPPPVPPLQMPISVPLPPPPLAAAVNLFNNDSNVTINAPMTSNMDMDISDTESCGNDAENTISNSFSTFPRLLPPPPPPPSLSVSTLMQPSTTASVSEGKKSRGGKQPTMTRHHLLSPKLKNSNNAGNNRLSATIRHPSLNNTPQKQFFSDPSTPPSKSSFKDTRNKTGGNMEPLGSNRKIPSQIFSALSNNRPTSYASVPSSSNAVALADAVELARRQIKQRELSRQVYQRGENAPAPLSALKLPGPRRILPSTERQFATGANTAPLGRNHAQPSRHPAPRSQIQLSDLLLSAIQREQQIFPQQVPQPLFDNKIFHNNGNNRGGGGRGRGTWAPRGRGKF